METVITKLSAWLDFKIDDKNLLKFKLNIKNASTVILKLINDTVKATVELDNFTKRTGVDEDFVYGFMNLAKVANVSTDSVLNGLETITKAKQNFLMGEGNIQPWTWLGVDMSKDPEEIFKDILNNIKEINDPALASKLLNDAGLDSQLINLVDNSDLNGINKNLFLDKNNREYIKSLSGEINKLELNLTLLRDKFVSLATPVKLGVELINRLIFAFTNIIESTIGLDRFAKILINTLLTLFTAVFPRLSTITLIALIIEDFLTYMEGGESVIGDFIEKLKLLWNEGGNIVKVLLLISGYIGTVFAVGQIMKFISTLKKSLLALNASFATTPLGLAIIGGYFTFKAGKWLGEKGGKWLGEKLDPDMVLDNWEKIKKPFSFLKKNNNIPYKMPTIPDNINANNINNARNNNVNITNNMNITGNNAKEIADNIKNTQDKIIMDNLALQLN